MITIMSTIAPPATITTIMIVVLSKPMGEVVVDVVIFVEIDVDIEVVVVVDASIGSIFTLTVSLALFPTRSKTTSVNS